MDEHNKPWTSPTSFSSKWKTRTAVMCNTEVSSTTAVYASACALLWCLMCLLVTALYSTAVNNNKEVYYCCTEVDVGVRRRPTNISIVWNMHLSCHHHPITYQPIMHAAAAACYLSCTNTKIPSTDCTGTSYDTLEHAANTILRTSSLDLRTCPCGYYCSTHNTRHRGSFFE